MEASAALSIALRELEGPALRDAKQQLVEAQQWIQKLEKDLETMKEHWMWERGLARDAYDDQYKDFTRTFRAQKEEIRSLKQQLKQTNAQLARRVASLDKLQDQRKHPPAPDTDAVTAQDS